MSSRLPHAMLTVSIDRPECGTLGLSQERSLDAITARLLEMVNRLRIPATWALADPASTSAAESITAARGHEIAIFADATWMGRTAPRGVFPRELARRASQARAAGMAISTLVVTTSELDDQYDVVVKHGLTAIRQSHSVANRSTQEKTQPGTPRFGLWNFAATCVLPGTSRLWPGGGGGRKATRAIDRAVRSAGLVHLVVDTVALVDRGHAAVRVLERVLERASSRRATGALEIATLAGAARRLTDQCTSKPSRSILRPAA